MRNRAFAPINRQFVGSTRAPVAPPSPAMVPSASANQGRGRANLRHADSIIAQTREIVDEDLEPIDPGVDDGDPSREIEPRDPSASSSFKPPSQATVVPVEPKRDEDGRFTDDES